MKKLTIKGLQLAPAIIVMKCAENQRTKDFIEIYKSSKKIGISEEELGEIFTRIVFHKLNYDDIMNLEKLNQLFTYDTITNACSFNLICSLYKNERTESRLVFSCKLCKYITQHEDEPKKDLSGMNIELYKKSIEEAKGKTRPEEYIKKFDFGDLEQFIMPIDELYNKIREFNRHKNCSRDMIKKILITISLDFKEKRELLKRLSQLSDFQCNALLEIFVDEKKRFIELSKDKNDITSLPTVIGLNVVTSFKVAEYFNVF